MSLFSSKYQKVLSDFIYIYKKRVLETQFCESVVYTVLIIFKKAIFLLLLNKKSITCMTLDKVLIQLIDQDFWHHIEQARCFTYFAIL